MDRDASNLDETIVRRPVTAPPAAPESTTRLLCSVGRFGVNWGDDVMLVRTLLAAAMPTPIVPQASARHCDEQLVAAISAYQSDILGIVPPHGRIDPAGATSVALGAG